MTFVPSALYGPGILTNLLLYAARRAVRVDGLLSEGAGGNAVEIVARRWQGFATEGAGA